MGIQFDSLESLRDSKFAGFGEAKDIGVFGGKGTGCLGALGERGRPGKPFLGDNGGDPRDIPTPPRGILGVGGFVGRWFGRGLKGRPGLIGFMVINLSVVTGPFGLPEGLSTLASEAGGDKNSDVPAAVGSRERAFMAGEMGAS